MTSIQVQKKHFRSWLRGVRTGWGGLSIEPVKPLPGYGHAITVAWPLSDVFQNVTELQETSKKRCLTVGRRSHELQPLSHDHWATFFKSFLNGLTRRKIFVWKSADGGVTVGLLCALVFSRTAPHTLAYVVFLVLIFCSFQIWSLNGFLGISILFPTRTVSRSVHCPFVMACHYIIIILLENICLIVIIIIPSQNPSALPRLLNHHFSIKI